VRRQGRRSRAHFAKAIRPGRFALVASNPEVWEGKFCPGKTLLPRAISRAAIMAVVPSRRNLALMMVLGFCGGADPVSLLLQ